MEHPSTDRVDLVAWCLQEGMNEVHIFDEPADEVKTQIQDKVNWVNVGLRAARKPELTITFYGEIRETE